MLSSAVLPYGVPLSIKNYLRLTAPEPDVPITNSEPLSYLQKWIDQLRWQQLKPMEKLAQTLLDHLEGILNYCRTKVPMDAVEAVNGNIKALLRRGRGYRDMNYLLLKAQRLAATKTEFVAFQKAA
jgi:transposase